MTRLERDMGMVIADGGEEGEFDEEPGGGDAADLEPPNSAQECAVSIEQHEMDDEEYGELYAHGEAYDDSDDVKAERKLTLARVSEREIVMFPRVSASYRYDFLHPKYRKVHSIRIPGPWPIPADIEGFDSLLGELPVGFSRHARRGLGLRWDYRLIVEAIEATGAEEIVLVDGDGASLNGSVFTLGRERFEAVRLALDAVVRRARRRSLADRRALAHNEIVHPLDEMLFPKQTREAEPGEIFEIVQLSPRHARRDPKDMEAAVELALREAPALAKTDPGALMELRSEIERVTLSELIGRFQALMIKEPKEGEWQRFFEDHPFVLSVAFPYPVTLVCGQAHVGGTRIDGRGAAIADFLYRQRFTGEVAIFEIKTTKTQLVEKRPFRGDLHAPHKELCAAMAQALEQRLELTMNFHALAASPGLAGAHVAHVHCLVIAGKNPESAEERRSLDLFRSASKDIAIVTFDELLGKLHAVRDLMIPERTAEPAAEDAAITAAR